VTKIFKIDYQAKEGFFLSIRLPQRFLFCLLRFFTCKKKGSRKERIELKVH